jgi:hypothetical protein
LTNIETHVKIDNEETFERTKKEKIMKRQTREQRIVLTPAEAEQQLATRLLNMSEQERKELLDLLGKANAELTARVCAQMEQQRTTV